MKFSLIGTGFIFPTHLKAIEQAGGEIVGYDTNEDCVSILTPNFIHFPMIIREAEKGKIVLCEKPLVISPRELNIVSRFSNLFTVLQLRHHPFILQIKELKKEHNQIKIDVSVHRPPSYYLKWKGQRKLSGGILYNLGIHYLDILIWIFGRPDFYKINNYSEQTVEGEINSKGYQCQFRFSTDEDENNQRRLFVVNGKEFNFSKKDNLAYENLHKYVYQDLMEGKGVLPIEQRDVIYAIDHLYQLI